MEQQAEQMLILFGKHGQVATELIKAADIARIPLHAYSSAEVDFRNPTSIQDILNTAPAGSVVINAAAYTQVDLAESNPDEALQINGTTPVLIARTCHQRGFKFIHISTDYVFSGEKNGAYSEDDPPSPLGVYGSTKLAGETGILQECPESVILRTSWVFSAHGKNFVKTMLRLGKERSELSVVADQQGGPTSAASIARACLEIASQIKDSPTASSKWGIYHYSGAPATTWHGFASEIFRQSGLDVKVNPITTADYPTPARRPANSVLNCEKIQANFGISQPDWKQDLAAVLHQIDASPFVSNQ
ncbi:dTDP-4-dehydrorhamnose reductase [Planctomicrobium sp. SH661]|uniref:dTDP-4-dehydrorhamnose reductase n=1 Tax=Planctomicrobium sp. SH661 TaxID=3448124 RepID=UPI003F5BE0F0